jgi:hypothetical protein
VGCVKKKESEKVKGSGAAQKKKKTKETLGWIGCWRELSLSGFNYFQTPFSGLNQIIIGFEFEQILNESKN